MALLLLAKVRERERGASCFFQIVLIYFLDEEDIIDETLNFFRANVFFRNFDVRGSADRTMIYLTLYTHQCLVKCEKIEDRATGNQQFD